MSTTYTPTATAVAAGAALPITAPADGDLLTAASQNIGQDKLADYLKQLVNQALLVGKSPSYGDSLVNGLLLEEKSTAGDALTRIYLIRIATFVSYPEFWVTTNASWNGTVWSRDRSGVDSLAFRMGDGKLHCYFYDNTAADGWSTGSWQLSPAGGAAGVGLISTEPPIALTLTNSWVNYGAPYGNAMVHKDPFGRVTLMGVAKSGNLGSVLAVLPVPYRPAAELLLPVYPFGTYGDNWVAIYPNGNVLTGGSGPPPTLFPLDGVSFIA